MGDVARAVPLASGATPVAAEAGRREGSLSAVLVGRKRRRVVEDSDSEGEVAEAGEAGG